MLWHEKPPAIKILSNVISFCKNVKPEKCGNLCYWQMQTNCDFCAVKRDICIHVLGKYCDEVLRNTGDIFSW